MKRFLCSVIIALLFCSNAFAAQFEGNKWGKTKEDVADSLNEREKLFKFTSFGEIKYNDTMFGYPCEVLMSFDDEYGLYRMWLAATGSVAAVSDIENKVLAMLEAKYGQPQEIEKNNVAAFSTVTYKWFEPENGPKYPDIKVHLAKKSDGTGSVFLEYADSVFLAQRDKKRAGII